MQNLSATELTSEAFAAYGEVFRPGQATGRVDQIATLQNTRPLARPNLFLARTSAVGLPFGFARMEQHPHSSQSFLPFGSAPVLIAAALPGADGMPDLGTLRGFIGRGTGFSYRAGVWHIPIASLGESVAMAGFMYEDGTPEDCVWADVPPRTLVET